jgi:tetratricopeptide (TPR) repeat protein
MTWVLPLLLALGMAAESGPLERKLDAAREFKQQGASAEAAKAYDALLPEVRASGDRKLLAQTLLEAGQLSLAAGDYSRALVRGEEARTLFEALRDPANQSAAGNLAGSAQLYRGEYASAIAHYQAALELDRRRHDVKGEIRFLTNLAGVYFFQGRYLDALDSYQSALHRAEQSAGEEWAANRRQIALTNLAVLYEQLGQNQKALDYYRQALAGESALQPAERGQLLSNAGTLYRRLGDAVKALENYREAQKLLAREHLSDAEIHVQQNVGIALALDMKDASGAEQAFTAALASAETTLNRREIVLAHLFRGEAYLRSSRLSLAKTDFTAALDGARTIGGSEEQWTALYGLARFSGRKAGPPRRWLRCARPSASSRRCAADWVPRPSKPSSWPTSAMSMTLPSGSYSKARATTGKRCSISWSRRARAICRTRCAAPALHHSRQSRRSWAIANYWNTGSATASWPPSKRRKTRGDARLILGARRKNRASNPCSPRCAQAAKNGAGLPPNCCLIRRRATW